MPIPSGRTLDEGRNGKTISYGEWVLHPKTEANDNAARVNEPLLAAARAAWPRVLAHAKWELRAKNSPYRSPRR